LTLNFHRVDKYLKIFKKDKYFKKLNILKIFAKNIIKIFKIAMVL